MFLTFSQLPNKYIIKSNKTQIHQNPNCQYPTKKKFIKSEINPKSENNKTRTTHATTITTRKSEIKESKRIGDEIDPEEDQPRASRSVIRRDDLGFDEWCDDFWVRDDRWRMGSTISGFMTIGVKWVWRFLGSRSEEWVRRRNLSLSMFAHLSPSFSRSLSLFGHCSTNELCLGFFGFVGALGCGSISPSPVLGYWCDLSSIFLGRKWFEVKMRTEIIFCPLSLILRSNWKHFQFDRIFSNSQTSTFPEKHFRNQFEAKTNGA